MEDKSQIKEFASISHYSPTWIVGLLDCSATWFLQANKSDCLPYLLAEQGYDVWVGNNRGTKLSQRNGHRDDYWDYTFDHLA